MDTGSQRGEHKLHATRQHEGEGVDKTRGSDDGNNTFTIRDLTVEACLQLHACLCKHSSMGPKQLL